MRTESTKWISPSLAGADQFPDAAHGGRVAVGVVAHQGEAALLRLGHQAHPVGVGRRQRLLHEDVLAGAQGGQGDVEVGAGGRGHGDRGHVGVGEDGRVVRGGLDRRVAAEDPLGPVHVEVAQPAQPEPVAGLEVAYEVGAPVSGPDDRDPQRLRGLRHLVPLLSVHQ